MDACGLIVEYNPFHNGHLYHVQQAKKSSKADCIIAVMSGSFLQRGEPAIIDKFHRTQAALASGVDLVVELPYSYAVQNSDFFAKGAVHTLDKLKVSSICFGSESGNTSNFITSYKMFKEKEAIFHEVVQLYLKKGISFPEASKAAYKQIGLSTNELDLTKPNNILGFGYIRAIFEGNLSISPITIERTGSNYHDQMINNSVASATSIRKALFQQESLTEKIQGTLPVSTCEQLIKYKKITGYWHTWENYFPLLQYRVLTMTLDEIRKIHGVTEGIEYRIKKTAKTATSFSGWMDELKTKRYTRTRLQRMFVHILTNTKKEDLLPILDDQSVSYVRLLGFNETGRKYINLNKKKIQVPLVTKLTKNMDISLSLEEKASNAYYSILPPSIAEKLRKQELQPPIII
ncbi:nucleotidyltransferase [Virgibacillus halodenitrificans]|uniref:nucleotidyltransferase n=1 Tax=Virgibacillus halodenitrificans TaxID=1482 RepID=UPI001F44EA7D|nr:nucleotidyltransferase [Virgibacillus halodenitrificans]